MPSESVMGRRHSPEKPGDAEFSYRWLESVRRLMRKRVLGPGRPETLLPSKPEISTGPINLLECHDHLHCQASRAVRRQVEPS